MANKLYVAGILAMLVCNISSAQENQKTDTIKKAATLQEVTVTTVQKAIENAPGKTIVNVQAMPGSAGKNVLELLRKLPGITVGPQGEITMAGKQGVLVTIDGRQTYLQGDELRDYLQGMTSEEVAQIELMTQPPAQYDAEGNAGIINIRTRKLKQRGLNGSATAAFTKSKYYASNNTLLLNYRTKKINLHSNISCIKAANTVAWDNLLRFNDSNDNTIATSHMRSVPVEYFEKWNLRTGADYTASEKTTLGIGLTGAYYSNTMQSVIETNNTTGSGIEMQQLRNTEESSLRRNAGINVYGKHTLGERAEITLNIDYLLFTRIMRQHLNTDTKSGGISLPGQLTLKSQLPINIHVGSARADYVLKHTNSDRTECGLKISKVNVDNTGLYSTQTNGIWSYDSSRSNHFRYNEQIIAGYLNRFLKLTNDGRWEAQLGLRGEIADIQGEQLSTGATFKRRLPALFPTGYVSYKPNSDNALELNYGRRVERPHYNMLNPFNYYTFYNTYQRGNPELLPQYSHNVELRHMYKSMLTTTLSYSSVTNNITDLVVADNLTQTTYGMPINFGSAGVLYLSMSYTGKLRKWWDVMIGASANRGTYSGIAGNSPVKQSGGGAAIWMSNQIVLNKWLAESWLSYNSRNVTSPIGISKRNLYMNFGVSRKFLKDTLQVRVAVDDPLYLYNTQNTSQQPGLYSEATLQPNSRYGTLSIAYSFGNRGERGEGQNKSEPEEAKRL